MKLHTSDMNNIKTSKTKKELEKHIRTWNAWVINTSSVACCIHFATICSCIPGLLPTIGRLGQKKVDSIFFMRQWKSNIVAFHLCQVSACLRKTVALNTGCVGHSNSMNGKSWSSTSRKNIFVFRYPIAAESTSRLFAIAFAYKYKYKKLWEFVNC